VTVPSGKVRFALRRSSAGRYALVPTYRTRGRRSSAGNSQGSTTSMLLRQFAPLDGPDDLA
jgi:hypothetical protein